MFPNQGIKNLLDFLCLSSAVDLKYHLFKNNHTVVAASVIGDFTESDFTGYAGITGVAEGAATIIAGPEAESLGPTIEWECTADLVLRNKPSAST